VILNVDPVAASPNLDILAELRDASNNLVLSNNPDAALNATIIASLTAGEYTLQVSGVGRGDRLVDGYTDYGSLGAYTIGGTVTGGEKPDRITVFRQPALGATIGTVAPRLSHSTHPLSFAIASGNSSGGFAINSATGALLVADPSKFDYNALVVSWEFPVTYQVFVSITDTANPALNEQIRLVVTVTKPSADCDMLGFNWSVYRGMISGTNVTLTVPYGTNLTSLNPTCTVSPGATVSPASGSANNFTNPVSYTVTTQDGTASRIYLVTVIVESAPNASVTVPPGLNPGDPYRLVFVTSAETYGWAGANGGAGFTTPAQYNIFAANLANAVPKLNALNTTWKAVVATYNPGTDARTNTLTRTTDPSVPIYNLGGLRVADNNTDLWDGSIQNPINVTELGAGPAPQRGNEYTVWTGIYGASGANGSDWSLISPSGGYINCGNATATDGTWASTLGTSDANARKSDLQPVYVMSGVLTVPVVPEITIFNWGGYTGVIDQTARTVLLTVPNGTDLATLNPTCTLTQGATVMPASGPFRARVLPPGTR